MASIRSSQAGETVPLVLLHAFPLDARMWTPVARELEAHGLDVITLDLPGFGGSPVPSVAPALRVSADLVAETLDSAGTQAAVVVGISMGGYVAMEFAARYRDRCAGLGLVDTKATADSPEAVATRLEMADRVESERSVAALSAMPDALLGASTRANDPRLCETVSNQIAEADPAAVAWTQRAMTARSDYLSQLAEFSGPALIAYGEQDTISPAPEQQRMIEALPGCSVKVIPEAGHLSALERSDQLVGPLMTLVLNS